MKQYFSNFMINSQRAIISIKFILCVSSVPLVVFLAISGVDFKGNDVLGLLELGISGTGSINLVIGILPIIPFAITFASEWEERTTSFWIIRTGVRNYAINKVIVSALSGFLVTVLGLLLFVLVMWINQPFFSHVTTGNPYAPLLEANMTVAYLFFYVTHIALGSALFAVVALWVSTYIPNKFVAIAAPLVIYFVAHRFTTELEIPQYFKAVAIVEQIHHAGTPLTSLLLKLGIVLILCLLTGYAVVRQIRRRVQND